VTPDPFHPRLEDLPESLPIFPLPGVILLPRAQLPLNIFEPRYLNMTLDALGAGRLIGMVQPESSGPATELVYSVGCAGRITAFSESGDGRLLIVLTGVCRFRIAEELSPTRGYRRVRPDWRAFAADRHAPDEGKIRRADVLQSVRRYAEMAHQKLDWEALRQLSPEELVNALAMHLPFSAAEKQSLVEAETPAARAEAIIALTALAAVGDGVPEGTWH